MKKMIIIMLIILSGFVLAEVPKNYEIKLQYDNGDLNLRALKVEVTERPIEFFGSYIAEVRSFDNSIINTTNFYIPNMILFDSTNPETEKVEGGYTKYLNQTDFLIRVPYFPNAKEIILYDSNYNEKLRIDVSMFSKEIEEVPEDILAEDLLEEAFPEEDAEEDVTKKLIISKRALWVMIIIVIFLFLLIFYIIFKKKSQTRIR